MTMYGADGLEFVRKLSQIAVSNLDLIDMEISEPRPMRERVPIFEIVNQWPHLCLLYTSDAADEAYDV